MKRCSFLLKIKNIYTGAELCYPMTYILLDNSESFISLPTASSGLLLCTLEELRCTGYMSLFAHKPKLLPSCSCLVLPLPQEPANMDSIESPRNENLFFRPKPGGGYSEEHELRAYRPGDSINSIHWKLSTKLDDIIIREAMEPVDNGSVILLRTDNELDLSHLYWLSLRLCSLNMKHCINYGTRLSSVISNETDTSYALRQLLSSEKTEFSQISSGFSRIFEVNNGEVYIGE